MSIKRQIQFKYKNLTHSLQTIELPLWLTSKTARVTLTAIIFIFSIAYIINITSSATSGYKMHELEKRAQSLETEVRKLQVEIADSSSMSSIQSRITKLNMLEASNIKYFAPKNTAVAKN